MYTVVSFSSITLGTPPPLLITTSTAYTSCSSNSASSTRTSGPGTLSTTLLPSITKRFIWCVSTPSSSFTP